MVRKGAELAGGWVGGWEGSGCIFFNRAAMQMNSFAELDSQSESNLIGFVLIAT